MLDLNIQDSKSGSKCPNEGRGELEKRCITVTSYIQGQARLRVVAAGLEDGYSSDAVFLHGRPPASAVRDDDSKNPGQIKWATG